MDSKGFHIFVAAMFFVTGVLNLGGGIINKEIWQIIMGVPFTIVGVKYYFSIR